MYVAFSGWSELDFSIGLLSTSLYQLQIEDSPMFDRHFGPQTLKPSQVSMKTRGLLINASASSVDQRCQLWGKGGMLLVSNGLIHVIINLSKPRHKLGAKFATKSSSFSIKTRAWPKLSSGNSSSTTYFLSHNLFAGKWNNYNKGILVGRDWRVWRTLGLLLTYKTKKVKIEKKIK